MEAIDQFCLAFFFFFKETAELCKMIAVRSSFLEKKFIACLYMYDSITTKIYSPPFFGGLGSIPFTLLFFVSVVNLSRVSAAYSLDNK